MCFGSSDCLFWDHMLISWWLLFTPICLIDFWNLFLHRLSFRGCSFGMVLMLLSAHSCSAGLSGIVFWGCFVIWTGSLIWCWFRRLYLLNAALVSPGAWDGVAFCCLHLFRQAGICGRCCRLRFYFIGYEFAVLPTCMFLVLRWSCYLHPCWFRWLDLAWAWWLICVFSWVGC